MKQLYISACVFIAGSILIPARAEMNVSAPTAASQQSQDNPSASTTVIVSGSIPKDGQRASNLVTGTGGSVMDVPFSVNSIAGERVRDQAGTSLQDALRNVPGAQADSGFNGAHAQFFILRGAVADSGTGSNRVLRDSVRLSNYPYVPAFVESVDVLRGPGAAVGVRSEPGGTVNIMTRQPAMRDAAVVLVSVGEHAARELTIDINKVLSVHDELALRIIGTRSDASEWRHVPDHLEGVKLAIAKGGGGRYRLRAGIEATNQTYRPDYGIPAAEGRPVEVPLDRQFGEPFGDSTTNNRIADLHADIVLDAGTRLAADLTHLEAHSTSIKSLLNGSPLPGQPAGTYARVAAWEPDTHRRIDSVAISAARHQTVGGLAHQWFFGLDYYRETLDQPTLAVPASISPAINVYSPVYGRVLAPPDGVALARSVTKQYLEAVSASLQEQVDAGAWSLVAGLRYTNQDFVYGAAGVLPVAEARWSPKLGMLYRLSTEQTLYANIATGMSPNQASSSSNQSLASRTARQAEAGWKALWNNGAVVSEVVAYQLKQANMISADQATPANNFDFTLGGSARSRGLEASLTGFLTRRLNIAGTYAFTDAKYLENTVYGGLRVPNVARQAMTLWGQYHWDDTWRSGIGLYLQGSRLADEANTTRLPGYALLDFTHGWTMRLAHGGKLDVLLSLRNALDQRFYVSSHLHVSRWIMPGQGRNASATATYRF